MITKILDDIKGRVLEGIDWINIWFSNKPLGPFEKFTRAQERIDYKTLGEKENFYWTDIQNHWLYGENKEFYWSMKPNDLGDAAIWQGLYTLACAAKGDTKALLRSLKGHILLQTLGGDNRLARGADLKDGPHAVDPSRTYYEDKGYVYIQEVSESTLLGQLLGFWSILHFAEDQKLKDLTASHLAALADQIIKDGYALKDRDGKIAKFGDLSPSLTTAPIRIASLACLMLLAWKSGRNDKYLKEYERLTNSFMGSITHPETHLLWVHPQYQDLLAYFVLTMLITSEDDNKRKEKYINSLKMQWRKNREEGNSLYTYMVMLSGIDVDGRYKDNAKTILNEFNTNPNLGWTGKQRGPAPDVSDAPQTKWGWEWLKGGKTVTRQPLPIHKRESADVFWQRSPYGTGGYAHHEYNGLDFLVAYYLGKYVGAI